MKNKKQKSIYRYEIKKSIYCNQCLKLIESISSPTKTDWKKFVSCRCPKIIDDIPPVRKIWQENTKLYANKSRYTKK